MKTISKLLSFSVIILFLYGCSKDELDDPVKKKDAIMKAEVSFTGDLEQFDQTITIQTVSKNSKDLRIIEEDLEKTLPSEDVAWFTKSMSQLMPKSTYTTSDKISVLTLAGVIVPKELSTDGTGKSKVKVTIKIFSEQKLIDTKEFETGQDKGYAFSFPFEAR